MLLNVVSSKSLYDTLLSYLQYEWHKNTSIGINTTHKRTAFTIVAFPLNKWVSLSDIRLLTENLELFVLEKLSQSINRNMFIKNENSVEELYSYKETSEA